MDKPAGTSAIIYRTNCTETKELQNIAEISVLAIVKGTLWYMRLFIFTLIFLDSKCWKIQLQLCNILTCIVESDCLVLFANGTNCSPCRERGPSPSNTFLCVLFSGKNCIVIKQGGEELAKGSLATGWGGGANTMQSFPVQQNLAK